MSSSRNMQRDDHAALPPEFDSASYRRRYPDAREVNARELELHFSKMSATEDRNGSAVSGRADFIGLIPAGLPLLEIGPFANPLVRGPKVRYFDVLSSEQLRSRAANLGLDPAHCPQIDFVSAVGDLDVVDERFDVVVSSHSVEHQPDLVHHMRSVTRVLNPGGLYFLAIPDKRYCFDHFLAQSSIAEIISAHLRGIRVHDAHSVIEHRALTTHNDPLRHWRGDHGSPAFERDLHVLRAAVEQFLGSDGNYVDVHAWQFVPASFASTVRALFEMRLSALRLLRVYPTSPGSNEFYAVMSNSGQECIELAAPSMSEFDSNQYLLANPDVAAAGMDAREHYLTFGRHEGRKARL
jgi:SAM-dependent methyltransferase